MEKLLQFWQSRNLPAHSVHLAKITDFLIAPRAFAAIGAFRRRRDLEVGEGQENGVGGRI